MRKYKVIGLMSGTSIDGVDLAYCEFQYTDVWTYKIIFARTYEYSQKWIDLLTNISDIDNKYLESIHKDLGEYYGLLIHNFCQEYLLIPDFISSHGHTVFHEPDKGITLQIGSAEKIVELTHVMVINDFRTRDVKLGGQGAPLVPIGDHLLFNNYQCCLNLGGISNVSFVENNQRIAFDICPANMALNDLAKNLGKKYDEGGEWAREGVIDDELLTALNEIDFYKQSHPKSLGREWYEAVFRKRMQQYPISIYDQLRTVVEHIAIQISSVTNAVTSKNGKILVTGGGAHNTLLIERISEHAKNKLIIPEIDLIDYKEAMIFAFLGVLRIENKINVLSSVTGASEDHCSGVINKP